MTADSARPPAGPDPVATDATYWELDALLAPECEELWGLFCFERGALGAEMLDDAGPLRKVRHSFAAEPPAARWRDEFGRAYPDLPAPELVEAHQRPVEAWDIAWREHFAPLRLGRRLLVLPPWAPPPPEPPGNPALLRIVIDPGQGFGTGWHPSTALALEELEATLDDWSPAPPPACLLDVGTGSGILAIAGRLLGARAAVALDVDAVALPEARRNAQLSGLTPPTVVQGGPDSLRGRFPLVVANIVSEVLLRYRDALAALTAPGGCLILSGILAAEREALLAEYAAAGLQPEHELQREGWVALRLRRT